MFSVSNTLFINNNHTAVSQNFFAEKDEEKVKESLHVEIPWDTVAHLIGRNGTSIKQIEEETCTTISFVDPGWVPNNKFQMII